MRRIRAAGEDQLFEVHTKTLNGRYLMTPSKWINLLILGFIARALTQAQVKVHAFVFMSNHYHMLVSVKDAEQLSRFMCHLNGNMSRKLNRELGRMGKFWRRRFTSVPVSLDTRAQKARMKYILSHGVKERLVRKCKDWPGASSLPWLTQGKKLKGVWQDLTREYKENRNKPVDEHVNYFIEYEFELWPMPCWVHEEMEVWQAEVRQMVLDIEREEAAKIAQEGKSVLGVAAVLAADPWDQPRRVLRSKVPLCHAATKAEKKRMEGRIYALEQAYREASRAFRAGDWEVEFPEGTHRPMGRFSSIPGVDGRFVDESLTPKVVREWDEPRPKRRSLFA